jgi:hypothetical protein
MQLAPTNSGGQATADLVVVGYQLHGLPQSVVHFCSAES